MVLQGLIVHLLNHSQAVAYLAAQWSPASLQNKMLQPALIPLLLPSPPQLPSLAAAALGAVGKAVFMWR